MAKDVFWFKHDSNASRDIKLMEIKHIYDFWGIGLYWSVIEVLREQTNYVFSCSESGLGLLSDLVMCSDKIRFNNWFNDCVRIGLFNKNENLFYSESLCIRMGIWEAKKLNGIKGGRPQKTKSITESKPNQKPNENHKRREEKRREELEKNKNIFYDKVAAFKERYTREMLRSFYDYWSEHSENGFKMRFEKEKVFDIEKRLVTWANRDKSFNSDKTAVRIEF